MFGSSTLEVALGLIFVYLLLSLICSAANEIIATNSKRRSRILEQGILNLLTDPPLDKEIAARYKAGERLLPKDPTLPEPITVGLVAHEPEVLAHHLEEEAAGEGEDEAHDDAHDEAAADAAEPVVEASVAPAIPPEMEKRLPARERLRLALERVRAWIKGPEDSPSKTLKEQDPSLGNIFYDHPLVKTLYQPRWYFVKERKPAYIPASTFARALLDIMTPVDLEPDVTQMDGIRQTLVSFPMNSSVRRSLIVFLDEAKSSQAGSQDAGYSKLRESVEDWFNKSMDRVSDWYKRRTQRTIFVLAFMLAVILNADTIMIFQVLYHEPSVRAAILREAEEYAKVEATERRNPAAQPTPTPATDNSLEDPLVGLTPSTPQPAPTPTPFDIAQAKALEDYQVVLGKYQNLGIPLGWQTLPGQVSRRPDWRASDWSRWLLKLVGLLLTAAAITLGAPFWFDILNRFISFRTAVKPPEATPQKMPELMSLTTPQRPAKPSPAEHGAAKPQPEPEEPVIPEEGDEGIIEGQD
ncbi:MAG TPA: hypothetical protein VGX92_07465 [Pyrinomonadaceae bacterium]|jgi:hypothetical protein|nr:hypothetical protein [Pyrinomonadaceae bacterium]